jgi:hypothetical protein
MWILADTVDSQVIMAIAENDFIMSCSSGSLLAERQHHAFKYEFMELINLPFMERTS